MIRRLLFVCFILCGLQSNAQFLKNIEKELKRSSKKVAKTLTTAREKTSKELTRAREKTGKELTKARVGTNKELTKARVNTGKELTNARENAGKELTKARENTGKELTKTRENLSRELNRMKSDIDRELTDYKNDIDQTLTEARKDVVTEWNYFWATVCGENAEQKSIQRSFDQDRINRKERDSLLKTIKRSDGCSGGGVVVNSDGEAVLTDNQGRKSETPPKTDQQQELIEILDWNRKVYMDDWETAMEEKYIAGWLISPGLRGGVTWFIEKPGNVTKTNKLREAKSGFPMTGARRLKKILDKNNKPVLDSNGKPLTSYRLHKGTDYAANEGDNIYAAINGEVQYIPNVHKGFDMIRIVNRTTGHRQETLYVKSNENTRNAIKNGVKRGDVIGIADNIRRHPSYKSVPNHVHVNFISPEGVYIAPNNKFGVSKDSDWVAAYCEDAVCLSPNSKD